MPLGGRALVITDEEREPPLPPAHVHLVPREPRDPVRLDDDLGREVDGVDLGNLLGMELLDHVLGHEFPTWPMPGSPSIRISAVAASSFSHRISIASIPAQSS